jgi:hypothetical protein
MHTAETLIRNFELQPHPEGGFFRETYRAPLQLAAPAGFSGSRAASTAIYYMLTAGTRSAFHRIKSDEVWHFYDGGPLSIVEIDPHGGELRETILGPDFRSGQTWQHVVPAGSWFGARPLDGTLWSFVGCTVAPGFDFADFELADPKTFLSSYPAAADWKDLVPSV